MKPNSSWDTVSELPHEMQSLQQDLLTQGAPSHPMEPPQWVLRPSNPSMCTGVSQGGPGLEWARKDEHLNPRLVELARPAVFQKLYKQLLVPDECGPLWACAGDVLHRGRRDSAHGFKLMWTRMALFCCILPRNEASEVTPQIWGNCSYLVLLDGPERISVCLGVWWGKPSREWGRCLAGR